MKILSIGNSFSVDAHTYVRDLARLSGDEIELGNLYIGGCSLQRHAQNAKSGERAYVYFVNNAEAGRASLDEALLSQKWDYITLQQASHFSGRPETYEPHLSELSAHVRAMAPQAEIVMHETWAYEFNSRHWGFAAYCYDQTRMHKGIARAYDRAAERLGTRVIPVGDAVARAREEVMFDPRRGGTALTRDGFHLSLTLGRFLAGAVWYEFFTGNDVRGNGFAPEGTPEQIETLRRIAHETVKR